jgi:hypothetical protein
VQLDEALRDHFGHPGFRPGQREAVAAALAGRDVLLVMPTGSGKSLCYQLPALIDRRLTVVVSPLVSLMQDQVEGLGGRGELINSQRAGSANRASLERAIAGETRILYVAPERFATPGFADRLAAARVGLFVVDEAHCVSEWGHDFRPDYLRLGEVAHRLGAASIFATTATATPRVGLDVSRRLGLRDPVRITTGFDRPNLSYDVVRPRSSRTKWAALRALLAEHTYGYRVSQILAAVGIDDPRPHPLVSVLAVAGSDDERCAVDETIARQTYGRLEPVVVDADGGALGGCLGSARERATGDLVAVLDPASRYGPDYLTDLVNAFAYTDAEAVGKDARHLAVGEGVVRVAGAEHDRARRLDPRTLVVVRPLAERVRFEGADWDGVAEAFAAQAERLGARLYAADRFNFVAGGDAGRPYETAEI